VDEIACLFGIHKNYRACKGEGRTPDQRRKRPVLILGNDPAAFLEARRAGHKRPRKAGEFYGFRGRSPKAPAGSMTDCWSVTDKIGHRPDHLPGLPLPDESQGQPGDTG
jgi:hypothetical protein